MMQSASENLHKLSHKSAMKFGKNNSQNLAIFICITFIKYFCLVIVNSKTLLAVNKNAHLI